MKARRGWTAARRWMAVAAGAVALAGTLSTAPATAAASAPAGHRVLTYADQCLDLAAGSPQDGAQLVQNPCTGGGSQNFSFDSGSLYEQQVNTFTGKCWDVPGNSHQYGVIQYYCNGASNQRFRFVPTGAGRYEIRTNLGWCLTAIEGTVPGARLHLYPCTGESIQQFYVS